MKLTYRRCGDYYLPNIGIPAEDMRPLGKYGRMRMRYLREHRSLLLNQLLLSGKLMKHLYSIDDACQERMDLLILQMKAAEGVTEELKATDQMEWVRRVNSIHNPVEEILFNEQIYSDNMFRSRKSDVLPVVPTHVRRVCQQFEHSLWHRKDAQFFGCGILCHIHPIQIDSFSDSLYTKIVASNCRQAAILSHAS